MLPLVQFIQNNLLLIVVAFASGAMLLWPLVRRSAGGPYVDAQQATHLINREDALVVDVREPAEFGAEHILGAKNVPLARIGEGAGDLPKRKDKPLIAYCDTGNRAGKALGALKKAGFERVVNLNGGLGAWKQAGFPVERKPVEKK
jgi:rhodanese-related sulfurtransferase